MKLIDLDKAVRQHAGEFLCECLSDRTQTKLVHFSHDVSPPKKTAKVPAVGRLQDFYDTFGSVLFYFDEKSDTAARYIASPKEWAGLKDDCNDWFEDLSDEERSDHLPDWVDTCIVIGETPRSGNYMLMPTEGELAGHVFEFDHDGFEFTDRASDIVEYVEKLLKPDTRKLRGLASHMRFIEGDPKVQWWISQLSDNQGHTVATKI